jgi:hypothetical protein
MSMTPPVVSQNASRVYGIERDITRDSFERSAGAKTAARRAPLVLSQKRSFSGNLRLRVYSLGKEKPQPGVIATQKSVLPRLLLEYIHDNVFRLLESYHPSSYRKEEVRKRD